MMNRWLIFTALTRAIILFLPQSQAAPASQNSCIQCHEFMGCDTNRTMHRDRDPSTGGRRGFLLGLLLVAAGGVAASLLTLLKLVVPHKTGGYIPTVKMGDLLIYAEGDKKGRPLRLDELAGGDSILAYPKGKGTNYANIVRLIREKADHFQPPTRIEWTDQDVVAYSAVCTHLSCTVSWQERPRLEASIIQCPCHNGLYDPLRGAKVIGGPPPRPLPQLPIKVDGEGILTAAGEFAGPVGPEL
jgi:rieske iron-sulfur protein